MASIAFNTPAYRRQEISRIVFAQRRRACDALAKAGHQATAFIVADDVNLELADEFGFERVEHPNTYLGDKWNAGYRAAGEAGFDYVMPIGSDSLLDPALIEAWLALEPDPVRISWTTHYAVMHRSGERRLDCVVTKGGGGGMMMPLSMLAPLDYRPVEARLQRGCDGSTLRSLALYTDVQMRDTDVHQLAVAALQSEQQITSYDGLQNRWGVHEETDKPILQLRSVYGAKVMHQVARLYGIGAA